MDLYGFLARIFPTSFTAKVFLVAFVGTHVPLIVLAVWAILQAGGLSQNASVLFWALGATLFGTAATLYALSTILKPLYRVEDALRAFEEDGRVEPLPFGYRDEVGRLMARANRLVLHVDQQLVETRAEAGTDPLTGLLNRRGMDRLARGAGAVLLIDLDHFKSVNDTYGHAEGDRVLREVATALRQNLRDGDATGRFGGDEFVAFLPGADLSQALALAERLRGAIESRVQAGGAPVTVSIGAAVRHAGVNLEDAVNLADAGTYAAKGLGRNRVAAGDS